MSRSGTTDPTGPTTAVDEGSTTAPMTGPDGSTGPADTTDATSTTGTPSDCDYEVIDGGW